MNQAIETAATAYLGPKILRNFRPSWLVYGALAYLALRFMKSKGMLPDQADAALDAIDRRIETAKGKFGVAKTSELEAPIHH